MINAKKIIEILVYFMWILGGIGGLLFGIISKNLLTCILGLILLILFIFYFIRIFGFESILIKDFISLYRNKGMSNEEIINMINEPEYKLYVSKTRVIKYLKKTK